MDNGIKIPMLRGNPVRIRDGPATVSEEHRDNYVIVELSISDRTMRRRLDVMIRKSGYLLNVKDGAPVQSDII